VDQTVGSPCERRRVAIDWVTGRSGCDSTHRTWLNDTHAYVSTGGSSVSVTPCDQLDWKLKLPKQGGGRALFSTLEMLPALTAPCKEELCGCALWEVNPCVARRGRPCRRSKAVSVTYTQQMPLPLTISCSSKYRLVLTFLVLPFWCLLTRVVPDIFQKSNKTVECVCVWERVNH